MSKYSTIIFQRIHSNEKLPISVTNNIWEILECARLKYTSVEKNINVPTKHNKWKNFIFADLYGKYGRDFNL